MPREFSITIGSDKLSLGLRPSKRVPRNSGYLVTCIGAVGRDGALQSIDELTRIASTAITDAFPYPQIFVFTNLIIVCSQTKIYEWVAGTLVLKLTTTAGSTWSAVDFFGYVYLSNGKVAVTRKPESGVYATTTILPTASSICNFNGQVLVSAPDVIIPSASLTMKADPIVLTTTELGTYT
jgi:hypothetical protein